MLSGSFPSKLDMVRLEKVSKFCFAFYVFFFVLRFSVCIITWMCCIDNMIIWLSNFSRFDDFQWPTIKAVT